MPLMTVCPCCNDGEHEDIPIQHRAHQIMMTQVYESEGVFNYVARYYVCPVLNEIYVDDELQNEHMQIINEMLKGDVNGQEETKEQATGDDGST